MGILETVKDVAVLVQKADNIELYQKILELQVQVMSVLEENYDLKARVRELADAAAFQGTLEFRDNMYYRRVGETTDGPYCSKCWDAERKAVRLQTSAGEMWCPVCQRSAPSRRATDWNEPLPRGRNPVTGY
jgi:hypothetical protein